MFSNVKLIDIIGKEVQFKIENMRSTKQLLEDLLLLL